MGELSTWGYDEKNLKRALDQLEHDRAYIQPVGPIYQITYSGIQEVERRRLHNPLFTEDAVPDERSLCGACLKKPARDVALLTLATR